MRNIKALDDFNDPEYTYFWQLLAYHNAITPEMQRKALVEKVFIRLKFITRHRKMFAIA